MKPAIIAIVSLVILAGCQQSTVCPVCNCPSQETTEYAPQDSFSGVDIQKINAGKQSVFVVDNGEYKDVINCGNPAHGVYIVDELYEATNSFDSIRNLIITNTTVDYIGGCADILIRVPEIKGVYIYDDSRDTESYRNLIKWTPDHKLNIKYPVEYTLFYEENKIDLNKITEDHMITDGVEYRKI